MPIVVVEGEGVGDNGPVGHESENEDLRNKLILLIVFLVIFHVGAFVS